jgi:hypothetical protein
LDKLINGKAAGEIYLLLAFCGLSVVLGLLRRQLRTAAGTVSDRATKPPAAVCRPSDTQAPLLFSLFGPQPPWRVGFDSPPQSPDDRRPRNPR